MRKVLFLWSLEPASSIEELIASSDFSDCSVQGVLLKDTPVPERQFPFPCFSLVSGEKENSLSYPSIHYADMLNMIFAADTVIS